MDYIVDVIQNMGQMIVGYILPFLFVLTIVVFFHELGHFLVARWRGVHVLAFSVGFGPELVGFNDKQGTRWKICAVPLGGYVKFLGDENVASVADEAALANLSEIDRNRAFHNKSLFSRSLIVVAGPVANFLLAIIIFSSLFGLYGKTVISPRVDGVTEGSAAQIAGFQQGDLILGIDGHVIQGFMDVQRLVSGQAEEQLKFEVERDGTTIEIVATPRRTTTTDQFKNTIEIGVLGIQRNPERDELRTIRFGPVEAVVAGTQETWFVTVRSLSAIYRIITNRDSADQLGGPIRIAKMSGQVATLGLGALITLAAYLSISIGMLNLFPVPMLDGGHLLFYAIEAVIRRPLSERFQEYGFRVGLLAILALMVFTTWNDISDFYRN
ncbi:MAG: RIP metalloprotease RseP [Cohaesibacteraceae bacterium]|nr:RIP metalloprotease RseP [Cohaesibacteraceae bacterium]MBL4875591.1 RIP metalloprotease RseP [Cohaesibacteraceae bacterium]